MKKSALLTLMLLTIIFSNSSAQNWVDTWENENNFYTIRDSFNAFWKGKDMSVRGQGIKQFKRWEDFTEPRVYPSGDVTLLGTAWQNFLDYQNNNSVNNGSSAKVNANNQLQTSAWTAMGPFGNPTGNATNGLPRKAGRINFVTFDPTNSNIIWVGAAAGGLWKSTNGGTSWTTTTDNLSVIGCTDMAIDPTNTNIMYLATGDGYRSGLNPSSIGILKSTDGGVTWNPTQLVFNLSSKVEVRRIIINPVNPQIVMCCANLGIYRTTNGGTTWPNTPVQAGNIFDLEFNPNNPDTVYAGGLSFRRSVNAGATWTQIATGIPNSGSSRMEIATTPANPNLVYVVSATNTTYGMQGIYKSTDRGATFSTVITTPNLIGTDCFTTTGTSGQGWYDLAFDASPLNANELSLGALGAWRSTNGGLNWTGFGCAYPFSSPDPFIHADHHEFEYTPSGILYSVNDGGICKYTGTAWTDLTDPMNIAQIYKFGLSGLSSDKWISGHQDNGSNIYSNGTYSASLAADGMDCFIDRTNDQNMFASLPNGALYSSTNGGGAWSTYVIGAPGPGGWVTPWKQDPQSATTIWLGKAQLYKATIGVGLWQQTTGTMTGISASEYIKEFAIAPSNNQYIYVIHGTTGMQVSTNGGQTWTQSNNGLTPASYTMSSVTVDPSNPLVAWITCSGYSNNNKVFKTVNGGGLWTNISNNALPNLPVNCSVYELGNTNGRIYIGMDVGVYYMDNSTPWTLYNNALPNAPVTDLEISPASSTKLRAATFGRGVYQVDLAPNPFPPVSSFSSSGNICILPASLSFIDASSNAPTSWSWSISPAAGTTISTATSQNPLISINTAGTYTVSLTATNSFGTGTVSTQTITVGSPVVGVSASLDTICVGQSVTLTATGAASYSWQPGNLSGASINPSPGSTQTYTVTGTGSNACIANNTVTVNVSICLGFIPGANGGIKFSVYPNPATEKLVVRMIVDKSSAMTAEITDVTGRLILKQALHFANDKSEQVIHLNSLANEMYFLRIVSDEGKSEAIKIIKE